MKQSMATQLKERREQLDELYNNANKLAEATKKGELGIQRTEKEIHMIELKNKDIQRIINLLKRDLRNPNEIEENIDMAKKKLEAQVLETERMCQELENPSRLVLTSGDDPSKDELEAKLSVLERLVQKKKDVLLAGEISSKEITHRIQRLEDTSNSWREDTKDLLQETNEHKGRVLELRRIYTSQTSEIRIYDELIAANKTKITDLERDRLLREQLMATDTDDTCNEEGVEIQEASSDSNELPPIRNQSFERPTAYIPSNDDENTIRVPRPYGAMAPFKPGATMRHTIKPSKMTLY